MTDEFSFHNSVQTKNQPVSDSELKSVGKGESILEDKTGHFIKFQNSRQLAGQSRQSQREKSRARDSIRFEESPIREAPSLAAQFSHKI